MKRFLPFAVAGTILVSGCSILGVDGPTPTPIRVVVEGLRAGYTLEKLLVESEAIAIVRVTEVRTHLNNTANKVVDPTRDLVFTYSSLDPIEVLRGQVPDEVRDWGGTVGNFTLEVADVKALAPGTSYLLFLTDWLWLMDGQYESGYGVTGGPAGTFTQQGDLWVNVDGLALTQDELLVAVEKTPNDPNAAMPAIPGAR